MGADGDDNADHDQGGQQPLSLRGVFNKHSARSQEIEIKFIVKNDDPAVFKGIEQYFKKRGWVASEALNHHLLTRQLETQDREIYERGRGSLRIRAECLDNDLDQVDTPDICVKKDKKTGESGALYRGEYESRIDSFIKADFKKLLEKYPEEEYPEIHEVLRGIDPDNIREHFRIDCIRSRYLIDIPESETKLEGKRCVAELILDDVAFVFDPPDLDHPLIFHYDMEVECEVLFKPCDYDKSANAHEHVSSAMNDDEVNRCMTVIRDHILSAVPGELLENRSSKAKRGFKAFDRLLERLQGHIERNDDKNDKGLLSTAFRLVGIGRRGDVELPDGQKTDIFHLIGRSFKFVFDRHPIARHKKDPQP